MYIETLIRAVELTAEMAWDTWWALILGLTISGAVEVFVSEDRLTDLLGDDGWEEVSLGAVFGVASSSCSYSAVGTTKTLFKKGASAAASLGAFMFASTDLVVELGLVMWVLLGWQFVVGEYLGGIVAVVVMALFFRHIVPESWIVAARDHVRTHDEAVCATCDMSVGSGNEDAIIEDVDGRREYFCCTGCRQVHRSTTERQVLFSRAGWGSAANATMKDWEMIWRDLVFGFVVAGVIGAAVPQSWWTALFGTQGTFSGVVLNAVIAVIIGVLTFMCSVGNVPFALVLWRNGLPFGGVLAFIYADLIIPPLVNLYRRYYGLRMAATLFVGLFAAAVVAGVVIHYAMTWTGLVPTQGVVGGTLAEEYTTILNLLLTPVFAAQVLATYGLDTVEQTVRSWVAVPRWILQLGWIALSLAFVVIVGFLYLLAERLAALRDSLATARRRVAARFGRVGASVTGPMLPTVESDTTGERGASAEHTGANARREIHRQVQFAAWVTVLAVSRAIRTLWRVAIWIAAGLCRLVVPGWRLIRAGTDVVARNWVRYRWWK